ncbi:MAG: aromatic amino acid lyase, partial [Longimicrobiales bacterium]
MPGFLLELTGDSLRLEDVERVALTDVRVQLADAARPRVQASRDVVERVVREKRVVYGITTGFG